MTNPSRLRSLLIGLSLTLAASLSAQTTTVRSGQALVKTTVPVTTLKTPAAVCGNGVIEGAESCDDGGKCESGLSCRSAADCRTGACLPQGNDGCDASCATEYQAIHTQQQTFQIADQQPKYELYVAPTQYKLMPLAVCGNRTIEGTESCDDGNTVNGDGCSADCKYELTANTELQATYTPTAPKETVSINNTVVTQRTAGPNAEVVYNPGFISKVGEVAAIAASCGDGKINQDSERCDDGNKTDGDGCSSVCQLEYKAVVATPINEFKPITTTERNFGKVYTFACGDGKVDPAANEECDPPDGTTCGSDCKKIATPPAEDPCLSASPTGGTDTSEYKCCQTYMAPFLTPALSNAAPSAEAASTAKKSYECCVKNGGSLTAEEQNACTGNTGNTCADFDASKDYDGEPCTKESCDPATGKMSRGLVGTCVSTDVGCDAATCTYVKPECKVSGPATASKGDKVEFTVTDAAGMPFLNYDCKENAATAQPEAILVSQADYAKKTYVAAEPVEMKLMQMEAVPYEKNMVKATYYRSDYRSEATAETQASEASYENYETTRNYVSSDVSKPLYYEKQVELRSKYAESQPTQPSMMKEGTYGVAVDADKTVSCTITGPGGTSDPCDATVRVSACEFSCGQPNGKVDGDRRTSVGLDADCMLLTKPDASSCFVSVNGGETVPIADDGLVSVPTDFSGVQSFTAVCADKTSKAVCEDRIEVAPVCNGIKVTINDSDGTGLTAREGDIIGISVDAKGAKDCAVTVNGQKAAAGADGKISFGVKNEGAFFIDAVCLGGSDLNGNSLFTECLDTTVTVSSPTCGNKILETKEDCDDGNDDATDGCVACRTAICGDGVVRTGVEECDSANNDNLGSDCTAKCRLPVCGDGFLQKGINEECDAGDTASNDGCSSACAVEKCGDGIKQTNEVCDGEKDKNGQACTDDCQGYKLPPPPPPAPPPPAEEAPPTAKEIEKEKEVAPPPTVTAIPWVGDGIKLDIKKDTQEPVPTMAEPPSYTPPPKVNVGPHVEPPVSQPSDTCLERYPNKESAEYQCCDAYGRDELLVTRSRVKSDVSPMECCLKGVAKPHADGKLTPEEDQACHCLANPFLSVCVPCLGANQVADLDTCTKGYDSGLTITKDLATGKVIFESAGKAGAVKSAIDLCACPSPQSASSSFTCASHEDLAAYFMTPVGFSCLHPEQVEYLRKNGMTIADDAAGYRITTPLAPGICAKLGGETQPYEEPTTQHYLEREKAVQEKIRFNEELALTDSYKEIAVPTAAAAAPAAEVATEKRLLPRKDFEVTETTNEEGEGIKEINITKDYALRRELNTSEPRLVKCSLLRPACICEGPTEPEPETKPVPPVAKPPVERHLRMAFCRWNDDHAIFADTAEEFTIKDCPALTVKAFTSPESYSLYQTVSRYYGKPTDAHLAEVRAALLAELNNTKPDAETIISTSSVTLPAPEDGATLTALDVSAVREQFAVKKNIEMKDDGSLTIKDATALLALSPEGATSSLTTGPEVVSPASLFKSATLAESGATDVVLVVGTDAAAAKGGCTLLADGGRKSALPVWTILAGVLTLSVWRFRMQRRRASITSSTNTPAKGSSTRN